MIVPLLRLDPLAQLPRNAYGDDAGFDLFVLEDTLIPTGEARDVRSGVAIALPSTFFARIVGRSSALRKRGVLVIEGTIDPGFRGELYSYVHCLNGQDVTLKAGESVAQLIILPRPSVTWQEVDELPDSARGNKGFGSSGS